MLDSTLTNAKVDGAKSLRESRLFACIETSLSECEIPIEGFSVMVRARDVIMLTLYYIINSLS